MYAMSDGAKKEAYEILDSLPQCDSVGEMNGELGRLAISKLALLCIYMECSVSKVARRVMNWHWFNRPKFKGNEVINKGGR